MGERGLRVTEKQQQLQEAFSGLIHANHRERAKGK